MTGNKIAPKKTMVKDLEQGIDIISKRYPKEIAKYDKVAERVSAETNLQVTEKDILDYYESPVYQDCTDRAIHMKILGEI